MNGTIPTLIFAVFAVMLSACSSSPSKPARPYQPTLFSPNGEPLSGGILGHPSCGDAIGGWYKRVNVKGDGAMTTNEFFADTRALFQRMDLDHDGYITSAELSVFRDPYQDQPPKDDPRERRRERTIPNQLREGADPIMSADRNLNFRVSLDDLMAQAQTVFSGLDSGRKGYLTPTDAQAMCKNNGGTR